MIAFGSAVTTQAKYERVALPGCRLAAEPDSVVIAMPNEDSTLSAGYNRILDQLADRDDLEAVVLLHQDLEIRNPDFVKVVRDCLADPEVAIIGAAGAPRVRGLDWWEPGPVVGDYEWAYERNGGGEVVMDNWTNYVQVSGVHPVSAVDGMIMVLSSWAARNLRFDEQIDPGAHGYDVDICFQAKAAGKEVVVASLGVTHHHELEVMTDAEDWIETHIRIAEKWEGQLHEANGEPLQNGDWMRRARRAEAEAGAAKIARDELNLLRNEADRKAALFWERIVTLERRQRVLKRLAGPLRGPLDAARRRRERAAGRSV
jgi:GT2 family glycosyltransferase